MFGTVTERPGVATVKISQVVTGGNQPTQRHAPDNPLADKDGNVWESGVDSVAEMVEMMETSRQYQNNVQVMQTAKTHTLDTLRIGK